MKSVPLVVHRAACGMGHATRLLLAMLALSLTISVQAGEVIAGIKARGVMRCGVSEGIAGFSQRDETGRWTGLDADFCRAVAAAVLGDAEKVSFTPLKSSTRFPALQAGRIDLLVAQHHLDASPARWRSMCSFRPCCSTTARPSWCRRRRALPRSPIFKGATVCVEKGTTHVQQSRRSTSRRAASTVTPLVIDSASEVAQAFFAGRCTAYTSDASQLAAVRLRAPGGAQAFIILPERISKEPLAPVVMKGDDGMGHAGALGAVCPDHGRRAGHHP